MIFIKKLILAPIFLVIFVLLLYQFADIAGSSDFIFSLNTDTLIQLIIISILFITTAFLFVAFATLAQNWRITMPASIVAAGSSFLFSEPSLAIILSVCILASLIFTLVILNANLASYLTFQAAKVLGPSVKLLSILLILSFSVAYFLSVNKTIARDGFQIPDSLIDTALKLSPINPPAETEEQTPNFQMPNITPEQIELLKQNPEALKQAGLDPRILDALDKPQIADKPQNLTNDLVKQAVKDQLQNVIKPYIGFIPAVLALLLFFTLQFFTSIINIFISPLLFLIFYVLEKTGITHYEIEQREVRKLVV